MKTNGKIQLFPFLRVSLCLIVGIFIGDAAFTDEMHVEPLFIVIGVALLSQYLIRNKPVFKSCMLMISCVLIGVLLVVSADRRLSVRLPKAEVEYEAVVTSQPEVRGKVARCDLLVTSINGVAREKPFYVKASILRDTIYNQYKRLNVGDGITAYSRLSPPEDYYTGSNFDYTRWLKVHGFVAQTFIYHDEWQYLKIDVSCLSRFERARIRAMMMRQRLVSYYKRLGVNDQQQSVVAAMTLGDKGLISNKITNAYSISGTSHILALSGSNLSIIYTMLLFMFPWRKLRVLSRCVILVAIWLYVVLVGMEPSVLRAAVMLSVYSFATLLNRSNVSLNALFLTVTAMLLFNPLDLWDAGFQMSFVSVLALFVLYKPIYHVLPGKFVNSFRPVKWIWAMLSMSIAAQIGVMPLVLFYFGRFPYYFLISNLVVIPAATLILYTAFSMLVFAPLPLIQKPLAVFLAMITRWLNSYVVWIASLPGASIDGINVNKVQVLLIYMLIAAVYVLVYRGRRAYRMSRF